MIYQFLYSCILAVGGTPRHNSHVAMGAGASTAVDSEGNSLAVFRQLVPVYERLNMAGSSDEKILQALKQQWVELQAKHSHDMGCFSSKLPPEGDASTAVPNL